VTRQGITFTIVAVTTASIGLLFRWQEFLLIGLLFAVVLITSAIYVAYLPSSSLISREQVVMTTRLSDATFNIEVDSRRKRGLFVEFVEGPFPYRYFAVPRERGKRNLRAILNTHARCDVDSGPIHLVVSDAFGFFRRTIASTQSVRIVVQPRVFEIPGHITSRSRGDNDEGRRTGWGSQLSELVTEYNRGDELRRIHWRTSAKVGKLMVRKELSPERTDVMLCLDTDAGSYSVSTAFSGLQKAYDFEAFHELFVSLAFAESKSGKNVRVLTTGTDAIFELRHGMAAPFLRHMANTELVRSGLNQSENLLKFARQFRPRQVFFVTAAPNQQTLDVLCELQRTTSITVIGCNMAPAVRSTNLDSRNISIKTP